MYKEARIYSLLERVEHRIDAEEIFSVIKNDFPVLLETVQRMKKEI
ncbi:hypothetical protein [Bacteroides cellulosilyticus]|mgnify:CR=1 FL=1|jgi:hypothetical protein|nr:hypothetical protein [Bacteroides cellulosilyticus]